MLSVYLSSVVSLGIKPPALMITDIKKNFFYIKKLLTPEAKKILIISQGGGLRSPSLIAIY